MKSPRAIKVPAFGSLREGEKRAYDHLISVCRPEQVTQGTASAMEEYYALHVTPMNVLC